MKNENQKHGFVRVACAVPNVYVADPERNVPELVRMAEDAAAQGVKVLVFPELCITGYSCGDLFHQVLLRRKAQDALAAYAQQTADLPLLSFVGLPLAVDGQLFNVGAGVHHGEVKGVFPKMYLAEGAIFYENRWFAPGTQLISREIELFGGLVPIGVDLMFRDRSCGPEAVTVAGEICQDIWTPIPPSTLHALHGALILVNLSASPLSIGRAEYRRMLVTNQSAKCYAGYLYTSNTSSTSEGDSGESTSDFVSEGHAMIAENGSMLAESKRFATGPQLIVADMDLEKLVQERIKDPSFGCSVKQWARLYRFAEVSLQ